MTADFGVALHLGQVIYGNVGVPERLQFTLVGAAVNEVVRVQDLTKSLSCPVLAPAPFAAATPGAWRSLGAHLLRGFETPTGILAPGRDEGAAPGARGVTGDRGEYPSANSTSVVEKEAGS